MGVGKFLYVCIRFFASKILIRISYKNSYKDWKSGNEILTTEGRMDLPRLNLEISLIRSQNERFSKKILVFQFHISENFRLRKIFINSCFFLHDFSQNHQKLLYGILKNRQKIL